MRTVLISILLLLSTLAFCQLTDVEKNYLKEIVELRMINNHLKLDTLKLKIEIDDINRVYNSELLNMRYAKDSLVYLMGKLKDENDSLIKLKKQIYNLSKSTVILYQRENNKDDIFYLNLNSYDITINNNDVILLKPIKDESRWSRPEIWGNPQPDNLSLHLYPHKLNGDKLYIQHSKNNKK